ncbi:tRNA synthetase Thr [Thermoplasma volcanium GSS1]|uniref:Threonine--tRNA ligase n=1 Tax=Thermoplasma volcanium (strain ATCC 51530 / DSM 4299 / JCM 9571 / NBRC 15438 / GSS1) TaxID=273116 RepID=SYT_THEVO|nr:threonine--tRNA ligase [Thermoplasma volcanium]Q978W0.1 RecName: Full=Threonine--tRNA ligase; AltName: Full=Threonyl-tRNA synthetase; Short=ThrRS [Thermoplasma volcanium GSS1]BAB60447.1 tRNA synthetase Thr [Thermoplasma volcanium GSS1]
MPINEIRVQKGQRYRDAINDKKVIAVKKGDKFLDLDEIAGEDEAVQPVYLDSEDGLYILRHSAAHLLANAVTNLFPEALPNTGPVVENGFYYDFDMKPITEEDLSKIEEEMKRIVKENVPIRRMIYSKDELLKIFSKNPYKIRIINENVEGKSSVYQQGNFVDLCLGPHVPSTGYIKAFKLLSIASAVYKYDESKNLVRIYGTAFPDEKSLRRYLENLEEAKKRDHRKIIAEMDLAVFNSEWAPGFPMYTPNGQIIRKELIKYMDYVNGKNGWTDVWTPHVFKDTIWKQSGHYAKYKPNMYLFVLPDGDSYGIKPMNCPGHIAIFARRKYSYRDLPVKYSEPGTVYRYEKSGEVGGLTRPRAFTQDDGHEFIRMDQIVGEIKTLLGMVRETFTTVFGNIEMAFDLSVIDKEHPENYLLSYVCKDCGNRVEGLRGTDIECPVCHSHNMDPDFSTWDNATEQLRQAMDSMGITYKEYPGEAAFYGPKIDVHVKDALGRMWQLSTIQVDFFMPINFGLTYTNSEGKEERVVIIHRAIYGSYERFMAILLEHFAGKLPTWLTPIQTYVIPVGTANAEYARKVNKSLLDAGIRSVVDDGPDTVSKKIKMIHDQRPSYIVVVGAKEEQDNTVTVRNRAGKSKTYGMNEFLEIIKNEIEKRSVGQAF